MRMETATIVSRRRRRQEKKPSDLLAQCLGNIGILDITAGFNGAKARDIVSWVYTYTYSLLLLAHPYAYDWTTYRTQLCLYAFQEQFLFESHTRIA